MKLGQYSIAGCFFDLFSVLTFASGQFIVTRHNKCHDRNGGCSLFARFHRMSFRKKFFRKTFQLESYITNSGECIAETALNPSNPLFYYEAVECWRLQEKTELLLCRYRLWLTVWGRIELRNR